jgi:DNA-binding beta-propeller fold protein YncE
VVGPALVLAGCSIVATPGSAPVTDGPLAPVQPTGYVVCPTAVTPVELDSHTPEAPIPLPVEGTPPLGSFAMTTSPDGRWAYVVTQSTLSGGVPRAVLVPIDLATQRAESPIVLPGGGGTHAVAVTHDGRTVLAGVGTTIVPVDVATRAVGTPLGLGTGRTVFGMALSPTSSTLYVLVPGGVVPVDTTSARSGPEIMTGLVVSSVSSPHGIVVSADGSTVYVVGQGGSDYGGRLLPITAATGALGTVTGFDQFGISDPAAVALTADGATLLVADSADNWVVPVPTAGPPMPLAPVRLPAGGGAAATGTDHPSDIVVGPGDTGAFVVAGLDSVLPYSPTTGAFGRAVRVCSGATSMAVPGA